jgi:hypothetical protein
MKRRNLHMSHEGGIANLKCQIAKWDEEDEENKKNSH